MYCIKKKTGGLLLIALLAALGCFMKLPQAWAERSTQPSAPEMFAGETLYYKIDFWLLRGSAAGELCFTKTPGGYTALFEAETKGFLRLIAGHRKEIMESVMEYDQARQRLRPRIFTEIFIQNKLEFKRTLSFDYEKGSFTCTRTYPGGKPHVMQAALPEDGFEDMLTLFYNFRMGCYGPRREGGALRVPVVMKEQPSFITIDFPGPGSKQRAKRFNAALTMERNLTHARSKNLLMRLDDRGIPESALVIDAYFFGDLAITLTGTTYHESP